MNFAYRLTGTGWAEARITDEHGAATLMASYVSDALGDLLRAVRAMLSGADAARFSWEEEPGEYRWIFSRVNAQVHLRILFFRHSDNVSHPDENGLVVFETDQPLDALATAIADGAQAVRESYGEAGYLNQWAEHPFPVDHLAAIRELLNTQRRSSPP